MVDGFSVESIGTETLTKFVRLALGSDTLDVGQWSRQSIHGGGGVTTGGLYRFEGQAHNMGLETGWSLILKVIRRPLEGGKLAEGNDWRREVLAYSSAALCRLPGDIAAPRCFGILEEQQEEIWLWLEDVKELPQTLWGLQDYQTAARHLGRFNGAYLSEGPLPVESWWSQRWLRSYVESASPALSRLPTLLEHPLVSRLFPAESAEQVIHLLADRNIFLNLLERLPKAFCHLDANRRNLFFRPDVRGRQELVLVDWSSAGIGAVGEELAALIAGSVLLYGLEPADLPELERRVLAAYANALREIGWRGDEREIWLGFAVSTALRYTAYTLLRLPILLDERQWAWAERAIGHSIEDFIDRVVTMRGYLLGLATEAKQYV